MTSADPAELVRAVVAAARTWCRDIESPRAELDCALDDAVDALEAHLAAVAEQPAAVTWGRVCPGDRIRAKDGQWYEVTAVGPARDAAMVRITADIGKGRVGLDKPRTSDALVRRGPEGAAADLFDGIGITTEVLTGWTR